jgi:hypothetical protein
MVVLSGTTKVRNRYRRATRDEHGDLYPYFQFSLRSMAQFGLGVSVYLLQLLIIGATSILAGTVMIPLMVKYSTGHKMDSPDLRVMGSAVCADPIFVNVTGHCDADCLVNHRESCDVYGVGVICDMVMSLALFILFYFNMFVENVEDKLDEAIQTAQDYSVVVNDPTPDALDPDEYKDFFNRFGRVRNVTITKKNAVLLHLLLQKKLVLRNIDSRIHARVSELLSVPPKLNTPLAFFTSLGQVDIDTTVSLRPLLFL